MHKFNIKYFLEALRSESLGKNLIYLEQTDSTNKAAIRLENGDDEFTQYLKNNDFSKSAVIAAETQTSGAGRQGKKWHSPEGGLWFTVILKYKLSEKHVFLLNMVAAVSVYESLFNLYGLKASLKWPNDIYFNKKKLCGILSEAIKVNEINYINIGIGINVNNDITACDYITQETALSSVSIKNILDLFVSREELLAEILKNLEINFNFFIETKDLKTILEKSGSSIIF